MSEKKLTQEELLGELHVATIRHRNIGKKSTPGLSVQAYNQLKEIVGEHFGLKNWTYTFEEYYALPEPIRNYIAALETNADPPSMVRENIYFKETIAALERKNELLMLTIKGQQKPTVTRGDIEDLRCCLLYKDGYKVSNIIEEWLTELGFTVEVKSE